MTSPATLYDWGLSETIGSPTAPDSTGQALPSARDLAYDHQTGKFLRGPNGGRYFTSGVEGVRQAIQIKLLTFLGEWFLDLTRGVPHYQLILVKSPNFAAIQAELSNQILAVKGVKSITSISLNFDRAIRKLTASWTVDTIFGAVSGAT